MTDLVDHIVLFYPVHAKHASSLEHNVGIILSRSVTGRVLQRTSKQATISSECFDLVIWLAICSFSVLVIFSDIRWHERCQWTLQPLSSLSAFSLPTAIFNPLISASDQSVTTPSKLSSTPKELQVPEHLENNFLKAKQ